MLAVGRVELQAFARQTSPTVVGMNGDLGR
jgi:hypothetical protein